MVCHNRWGVDFDGKLYILYIYIYIISTPLKTNMEPSNVSLEDELPFHSGVIFRFQPFVFGGVQSVNILYQSHGSVMGIGSLKIQETVSSPRSSAPIRASLEEKKQGHIGQKFYVVLSILLKTMC